MRIDASLLLAEACREYGWTVDHCLTMPAKRFFKMLEAARKLRAIDRIDECYISGIATHTPDYQKSLIDSYKSRIEPEEIPEPVIASPSEVLAMFRGAR